MQGKWLVGGGLVQLVAYYAGGDEIVNAFTLRDFNNDELSQSLMPSLPPRPEERKIQFNSKLNISTP